MFAENEILIYKSIIKEIKELWWACNLKEQAKVLSNKLHPWLIRNLNAENLDKQIEHLNNLNLGIILKPENSFIVLYIKYNNVSIIYSKHSSYFLMSFSEKYFLYLSRTFIP